MTQLSLFPEKEWWQLSDLERAETYVDELQHQAMQKVIAGMKTIQVTSLKCECSFSPRWISGTYYSASWRFNATLLDFWTLWLYKERGIIHFSEKVKPDELTIELP